MIARYQLASLTSRINAAHRDTHTTPTDEQRRANNTAKGRFWWHGHQFVVENPRGTERPGRGGVM